MNELDLVPRLAKKLRSIRVKKNLTLQVLSEKAKVSKGLLSKIENSRTVPSLPVFLNIVHSLDVPLQEFFEGVELPFGKDYVLIRANEQSVMQKEEREGFNYRFILSQSISTSALEVALLSVQPGAKSRATTTDGFELKYVLSGTCDYFIGEEKITLHEGDALYFDASKPHMPVNRSFAPAIMLVVYLLATR